MILLKIILLALTLSTFCIANEKIGYTINSAFYVPAALPEFGIAGCEIDVLKGKNDKLSYGAGLSFDLINKGLPGGMFRFAPKIDFKLLNPKHRNIFNIHTSVGIAYALIMIQNKFETDYVSGIGGSFDFVPRFNMGKTFSLGIGSWNNLVFHTKSSVTGDNLSFYTKLGLQIGFKI